MIGTTPTGRFGDSSVTGTFPRNVSVPAAHGLATGATVGDIVSTRDRVDVTASHGAQIVVVEDGDLASPGQPLVRLHPEGSA